MKDLILQRQARMMIRDFRKACFIPAALWVLVASALLLAAALRACVLALD